MYGTATCCYLVSTSFTYHPPSYSPFPFPSSSSALFAFWDGILHPRVLEELRYRGPVAHIFRQAPRHEPARHWQGQRGKRERGEWEWQPSPSERTREIELEKTAGERTCMCARAPEGAT